MPLEREYANLYFPWELFFIYSHSVHSLVTETSFFAPYSESILCSFSVSRNGKADYHLFENINSTKCLGTVWETQDTAVEQWSSHQHWTWLWNILYKSLAAQLESFWSFVSREIFFFFKFLFTFISWWCIPLGHTRGSQRQLVNDWLSPIFLWVPETEQRSSGWGAINSSPIPHALREFFVR